MNTQSKHRSHRAVNLTERRAVLFGWLHNVFWLGVENPPRSGLGSELQAGSVLYVRNVRQVCEEET